MERRTLLPVNFRQLKRGPDRLLYRTGANTGGIYSGFPLRFSRLFSPDQAARQPFLR